MISLWPFKALQEGRDRHRRERGPAVPAPMPDAPRRQQEPQAGSLETGRPVLRLVPVDEGVSCAAEAPYPDGPLASRKAT